MFVRSLNFCFESPLPQEHLPTHTRHRWPPTTAVIEDLPLSPSYYQFPDFNFMREDAQGSNVLSTANNRPGAGRDGTRDTQQAPPVLWGQPSGASAGLSEEKSLDR